MTAQLPLWPQERGAQAWAIRESRRAKRLSVRVFDTGRVEVVVPRRVSPRTVETFLKQHRGWVERKCRELERYAKPPEPFPPPHILLPASGEAFRLHLAGGAGRLRIDASSSTLLTVRGDPGNLNSLRLALQRWLLAKAKRVLEPILADVARELQSSYQRIAIRRQRTRWGSCSTRGTISLNYCLLFQRPQVVRYLMVHELAHTVHMNHSRRFWQLVERHCSDYRQLDKELLEGWQRVPSWAMSI